MNFESSGLCPELLSAIRAMGFTTPTPIQEEAIPAILEGRDVLGCAPTGTGKTAAFGLPLLNRLLGEHLKGAERLNPRVLVLSPTRELAAQIAQHFETLSRGSGLRGLAVYGGVSLPAQEHILKQGVDWVVATPGRLLDHIRRHSVSFPNLRALVLDEADLMLDMGFLPEVREIISCLPERRQTLLFSATLQPEIQDLAKALLIRPVRVQVGQITAAGTVRQVFHPVVPEMKAALLLELLGSVDMSSVLVFTRTRVRADRLGRKLREAGVPAVVLHGDHPQKRREAALEKFRSGEARILVATDLAARGLDIPVVSHVVNFDVPVAPEDYIHRVGRTGRAGTNGDAVTLCSEPELALLRRIEHLLRLPIPEVKLPGFDQAPPSGGRTVKPRERQPSDLRTRELKSGKRESPFTHDGRARPRYAVPEPPDPNKRRKTRVPKRQRHQRRPR